MIYIKPDYYETFACVSGACEATCCEGWQIVIDEHALACYGKLNGKQGRAAKNKIDWTEGTFRIENNRCAFLNESNLCDLYIKYGAESLCKTCKTYPRHIEEFEGVRELSLSLSCPIAAKIILTRKKPVKFLQYETAEEENEDFEDFDYLLYAQLEYAREGLFELIQNRKIDMRIRMKWALKFAKTIQICLDQQKYFDIDNTIQTFVEDIPIETLEGEKLEEDRLYEERKSEYDVFEQLEHLRSDWQLTTKQVKECLEKGKESYDKLYLSFQKERGYESPKGEQWSIFAEQLMMFFIFTYFCGAVYDEEIYSKVKLAVFSTVWIQEFCMYSWEQKAGMLLEEDMIRVAYRYAREVEHSDVNIELLEEFLTQQQEDKEN